MNESSLESKTKAQLIAELQSLQQQINALKALQFEYRDTLDSLRSRQEVYQFLLDESSDPIFSFYADGTYRYVNTAFANGVGLNCNDIIDKKIWDVFPKHEADKRYETVKWVFEHGQTREIEVLVSGPDGDHYYLTTAKPVKNEQGEVITVICISKDITRRKKMEQELVHLGTYDLLTNLYNRNFFETELKRIQESRLYPVSIMVADLNHLKAINDAYGHQAGDDLLRRAAQILKETFRAEDVIARLGGDEFVVLLPETGEDATEIIVSRLRTTIQLQSDSMLSMSIGWSTGYKDCNLTEILHEADEKMYQEKALQRR